MKSLLKIGILSSLVFCVFGNTSCTSEMIDDSSKVVVGCNQNGDCVFTASLADSELSRTIRQDNGAIYWDKNECIKVFYNAQTYGEFISTNQAVSATASFKGQFNTPISDSDIAQNGVVAIYPSQDAEYNGNNVIFTLSSQQEAEAGTFKKGLFPSIAQSKSSSLSFYNICGGVKLSVYYEGIKSITLRGNNSEYLAGRVSVSFNGSGIPEYSVVDGVSEITLLAPQNGYFEVGKMYYIVALPGTLLNGFTIIYHTDKEDGIVEIDNTITIHRSKFGLVLDKDVHGFVVNFDDPSFKASVVDEYDDNFDGEIDYIEAESVTNINCSNRNVTSLGGIEYFTNLKNLNCSNNSIKEIDLSSMSKLTTLNCYNNPIESLILDGCVSLTSMSIIDATINAISKKTVTINGYQKSEKFTFSTIGAGFTDFSFVNSNTIKTLVVSGDYSKSLNVYDTPNVAELNVSQINVEVMDLHNLNLSSLDLTQNTNLKELYLQNNKLTSINLTKNTKLTKLNLSDNQLQSVNIRQNTLLTDLFINNNSSLSSLNIDNNLSLTTLEAEGLSISTIDMSQHSNLKDVKLRNNPQLRSMVIWTAATKKNDYLLFDMANVMVTDASGNSYGYPYSVGQYIPWFNGGVIYRVDTNGGGIMVNLRNITPRYYLQGEGYYDSFTFYWYVKTTDSFIPEMFFGNSETNGEANMKTVYDYYAGYDKFTSYSACAILSKDGKWYLPSKEELVDMLVNVRGTVNDKLYNTNNDRVYDEYWSSTISAKGELYLGTNYNGMNLLSEPRITTVRCNNYGKPEKTGYTRAIRKF